ncbi:K(+)-transporting ATPase subunit F [Knoellia remsis]|nr:K(+)-transporting ATPase subunit F [Knoellia remsis]
MTRGVIDNLIAAVIGLSLVAYLVHALLRPERY